MLPLIVGSVGRPEAPLLVGFESDACVPALPLRLRFLYSAIASASRSRTRDAMGERTEAGFIEGAVSDEIELDWYDGMGEKVLNEVEWLKEGEARGGNWAFDPEGV